MKIILGIIIICLGLIGFKLFTTDSPNKIGYMDNYRIFNEFEFKKKQDTVLEKFQVKITRKLDSLVENLTSLRASLEENQSEELMIEYNAQSQILTKARKEAQELVNNKSAELTNEVYQSLNVKVSRYGNENNYDFLLGSDGKGQVMYVDTLKDVTIELIEYINN